MVFVGVYEERLLVTHVIHMRAGADGSGPALAKKSSLEHDYGIDVRRIDVADLGAEIRRAGVTLVDVLGEERIGQALRQVLGIEDAGPLAQADKLGPFFKATRCRRYRVKSSR